MAIAVMLVESYKFWDVVALWSRERLEHELIVARALARGVIVDGLRLHSVDPKWISADRSLTGYPYVGYSAKGDGPPILLRAGALEHLLAVVGSAVEPSREALSAEFLIREDFRVWLTGNGQTLPSFWFGGAEPGKQV
jgi:hypothetical protein